MSSRAAWLVDNGAMCLGVCGGSLRWVTYTDVRALRFASKEDAEDIMDETTCYDARAIEHVWVDTYTGREPSTEASFLRALAKGLEDREAE